MFIIRFNFNENFATFRSELKRIWEEIDNNLSESNFIWNNNFVFNSGVNNQGDIDFLEFALRAHEFNAIFKHLLQIELRERVFEHAELKCA